MESRPEPPFAGPAHADLDLTNACNLQCSHCDVSSGIPLTEELDRTGIFSIIGQLYNLGVLSLTVAGGEPFLRPDAVDILERACSYPGWRVSVITNGTLLSGRLVWDLLHRCPGLSVTVSLDGSMPASFDIIRHSGRRTTAAQRSLFSLVTSGIARGAEAGLEMHAAFALTCVNQADLMPTYNLAI
ncbi:radical SAM protein, partial [Frankia sp. Cj3]